MTPTHSCLPACFLLLTALPACIVGPDIIGETLSVGELSASAGELSTSAGEPAEPLQYGEPCELVAEAFEATGGEPEQVYGSGIQISALSHNDACESGMCLLTHDNLPLECQTDADCDAPDGECGGDGHCVLTVAYVDEHARCTQACETAADCPDTDNCETGFSCNVAALLGQHCCEKVCLCNDELSVSAMMLREALCADGVEGCP